MDKFSTVELAAELESRIVASNAIEVLSLRLLTSLLNEIEAEFLRRYQSEE